MTQTADTFHALTKARFSCRAFLPDPIDTATITDIVKTARHTPSWCNAQPWGLSITAGQGTARFADALYTHAINGGTIEPDLDWPASYPDVYGERRRACGFQLYDALSIPKGDRAASTKQMMENFKLFGAPHVAIVHSPKALGPYGAMDCGGFVTAFCLAAQARGVATIPQAAIGSYAPFVKDWFGLGEDRILLCGISFGLADMDHPANSFRTQREDPSALIDWKD
ncbi:MAG: nitroreductase [Paracoccaceae bacterium]